GSMMTGRAAANLLTRLTTILVACFFVTSLTLAWIAKQDAVSSSVLDGTLPAAVEQQAPVTDEPAVPQVPVSN
ncbi:MAG: preprotein translocase subunit SecG, partial [Emcibacteraceae bacterium]|nr:preprotein translocase subunit SecG [Emcibacteraceae bacterium]